MRELTAVRRTADAAVALLADHALFHLEADLRWLELTASRIDAVRERITTTGGTSRSAARHWGRHGSSVFADEPTIRSTRRRGWARGVREADATRFD